MANYSIICTNSTLKFDIIEKCTDLKFIVHWLLLTILVVIMFSIGCEVTWLKMKKAVDHPVGICIGMLSQFFIIPLTAYTLLRSCGVKGPHAVGVLIISCCPGGILSNAFAYFCGGDLSLSVVMTFFSTLIAMGMTPFNLWIYGNSFETGNVLMPYGKAALSLLMIVVPVTAGMLFRLNFPNVVGKVKKILAYTNFSCIIFCIVLEVVFLPDMFSDVPKNVRGILLTLYPLGLSLGYVLAYSFRQDISVRKTIAAECGIQNVPTAMTIITSSFNPKISIILLPWLYIFAVMIGCIGFCFVYHVCKQYTSFKERKQKGFNLDIIGLQTNKLVPSTEIADFKENTS